MGYLLTDILFIVDTDRPHWI